MIDKEVVNLHNLSKKTNPYLYKITYFPLKEVANKGLPIESTEK